MGKLLKAAGSPEIINAAWKRCRNDKAVWEPGVSRKEMERNLGLHLLTLSEELSRGDYVPNGVRYRTVLKGNGKKRIISAITLRDKLAQRAVLLVISPLAERTFHQDSYGYRPKKSIQKALSRVREYVRCGLPWLVDADIEKFFDEIPHELLVKKLKILLPDKELIALIRRWLDSGAVRRGFLSPTRGIPQGSVISPVLCIQENIA